MVDPGESIPIINFIENNNIKLKYILNTHHHGYHVNGNISQTGYFLDGKNHGDWVSYDLHGNKISEGSFAEGKKVNRWLFWNGDSLIEVDYKDNKILRAKKWKKPELLASSSD